MTTLDKMTLGQRGKIMGFVNDSAISRRLMEMGFIPGRFVLYLSNYPLCEPI